ncbi:MAG: SCO family protein [Vicinamibacterales bacterium]
MRQLAAAVSVLLLSAGPAFGQYDGVPRGGQGIGQSSGKPAGMTPEELRNVRFDQRLGNQVSLDLEFRDETGRSVRLSEFFEQRPVVLSLVYYECPMLCTEVLNGLVKALKVVSLDPGKDFEIVTISFDARETPKMAADKKRTYLQRYQRPEAAGSWHFLTGEPESIEALTEAVGFQYVWDPAIGQYAHAAGIMVLTPTGVLAKYFYGIEFSPRDLRLALVDASGNRIGNPVDQVLLYCFHYDPSTGKYGLMAVRLIRLGGIVTIAVLGSFMFVMFRRERRERLRQAAEGVPGSR